MDQCDGCGFAAERDALNYHEDRGMLVLVLCRDGAACHERSEDALAIHRIDEPLRVALLAKLYSEPVDYSADIPF